MSTWTPQETGVHQICYLLAEVQKPGTNQGQVRPPPPAAQRPAPRAPPAGGRAGAALLVAGRDPAAPGDLRAALCAPLPAVFTPALAPLGGARPAQPPRVPPRG